MNVSKPNVTSVKEEYMKNTTMELLPTKERLMGKLSYSVIFLGGCVSIGSFTMGSGLIGTLNLTQSILAMIIGCSVVAIALVLIGEVGHKYGIPFAIQARSAFGIKGTVVPGLLRAIPAIIWFGFQSWVGAGAINTSLRIILGFDNLPIIFVLFIVLQLMLAMNGFQGIKLLENIAVFFFLGTLLYMFYTVYSKYGIEVATTIINIEGTWGIPFWGGTTAFLGLYSTMIVNVSDYSRELRKETKSFVTGSIYWISILPVTLFMGLIGLMISGATGNSDPVAGLSTALGNQMLTIITLIFVAFSQITNNVFNNIIPPAYVLMDIFSLSYRKSMILVGILSVCTFPWLLARPESARGMSLLVQIYSAFLGPIFAVLITDYYILRRKKINLNDYYNVDGPFKGINWAGIIAMVVGSITSLFFVEISWYVSLIPTGVTYYLLTKKMKKAKEFRTGTIFE